NPIGLQLAHLIYAEWMFRDKLRPGAGPALPDGFEAKADFKQADRNDPKSYLTKAEYLALWDEQRAGTKALLAELSDADLDRPGPEGWESYAPTTGALLNMAGIHAMSHI